MTTCLWTPSPSRRHRRLPESSAIGQTPTLALAPGGGSVAFVSDLHLSPALQLTVAGFDSCLQNLQADALFILGDLFEVWVGDDTLDSPFESACLSVLRNTARRMPVYVMRGNRDFLLGDRFFAASGCIDLPDPVAVSAFGETVLLTHGDALCLDDQPYQAFRRQVRDPAWQAAFLTRPLAERLSMAREMRGVSRAHQADLAPADYADVDPNLASQWLAAARARTLVHGHTHRPASQRYAAGWQRHVLSDWDLDHGTKDRAEVLFWTAQGFERRAWAGTTWV
jgi:UDP-2,3-diacylglucosamine hydrolase